MLNWILIANATDARIVTFDPRSHSLKLVREIKNQLGRAHGNELVTAEPGRVYKGGGNVVSAMDPRTDPKEAQVEHFVHEITHALNTALTNQEFEQLSIVALPHLLGELRSTLGPQAQRKLRRCISKNCLTPDLAELHRELQRDLPEMFRNPG